MQKLNIKAGTRAEMERSWDAGDFLAVWELLKQCLISQDCEESLGGLPCPTLPRDAYGDVCAALGFELGLELGGSGKLQDFLDNVSERVRVGQMFRPSFAADAVHNRKFLVARV